MHYEKFSDGTVKCIEDEIPFEIPKNWAWARLPSITLSIFAGGDKPEGSTRFRTEQNKFPVYSNGIDNDGLYGFCSFPKVVLPSITVSARGTVGYCCIRHTPFTPIVRLITVIPTTGATTEYLKLVFDYFLEGGTGTSIPQLTVPSISLKMVPVPPLGEQIRITQLCDIIFKRLNYIESEKADIGKIIMSFKSNILDLAIRGKLVPQDPNDEPASILLKRIRAEKEELIKQGKIKRDKKESVIFKGDDNSYYIRQGTHVESIDDQFIFTLPDNWEWCCLPNIARIDLGKTLDREKNIGTYYPYLRSVNVQWNVVDLRDLKEMRFKPEEIARYSVKRNDLLICEGGDVGRSCVWTDDQEIQYQNALHRVRFYSECNPFYFMYYMMYYESRGIIKALCKGVTIKHLTGNVLSGIPFALPPIEEQNRIVEKLNCVFESFESLDSLINT